MAWPRRLLNLLRSARTSREIDREMSFHVAERIDEFVAAGIVTLERDRLRLTR